MIWNPRAIIDDVILQAFPGKYVIFEYLQDQQIYRFSVEGKIYTLNPQDLTIGRLPHEDIQPETKPQEERKSSMNLSTIVFLINDNVRAVKVAYQDKDPSPKIFKTLDKTIKVDDFVIIPSTTRFNMTTGKVIEVDVDIDFDSSCQINWLIGRVDMADVNEIKAQEDKALDAIKAAEKLSRKNEIKTKLDNLLKEGGAELKMLTVGNEPPAVKAE